jgi:hypothetical protein
MFCDELMAEEAIAPRGLIASPSTSGQGAALQRRPPPQGAGEKKRGDGFHQP